MLKLYASALEDSADFARLAKNVRDGVSPISVFGVSDGQKTHLAAAAAGDRPILFITQNQALAEKAQKDLETYTGRKAALYSVRQWMLPSQYRSADAEFHRIQALDQLLRGVKIAVAPVEALAFPVMAPQTLRELRTELKTGERYDLHALVTRLVSAGYQAVNQISAPGEFFLHGGILDVFPIGEQMCVRADFFDDELDSLRLVDPVSMRSVEKLTGTVILPTAETAAAEEVRRDACTAIKEALRRFSSKCRDRDVLTRVTDRYAILMGKLQGGAPAETDAVLPYLYPKGGSILDYLPEDTLVVFDEVKVEKERCENLNREFDSALKDQLAEGLVLPEAAELFAGFRRLWNAAAGRTVMCMQTISGALPEADPAALFRFDGRTMQSFHGKPEFILEETRMYLQASYTLLLAAGNKARADRLETTLKEAGIPCVNLRRADEAAIPGVATVVQQSLSRGYEYPLMKLAVMTEFELFNTVKQNAKQSGIKSKDRMDTFVQLKVGDAVVHEKNGIGIYEGIVKIETDGVARDYLFLRYRDGDKLYVPVEQMHRVQKYIAPDEAQPKLNKLGTQEWSKTTGRAKKSIEDMTDKLLALYRARVQSTGHAFAKDTPWQRQFEEDFPYEETPDQLRCIAEIKEDMESDKVMDRLLCGDVGYGKTEVALRAVFKAVMDGKQAAILAPTTILAQQHYQTLKARLANFDAIRCDSLSRFKTPKEQKKTLEALADGRVDVVVGTHRLLGADVRFRDLGLLVVDEEQRFGVAHKEKIKTFKNNVDVLTLSATPIPRTLNMALSGIRDMSVIDTPPLERYPVQTYVVEYSDHLIRDAILREIGRGGQVYFLYNRVQSIDLFAEKLLQLVPQARIAVAHGQMGEAQLERVMLDFCNGDYDVLLCTTIIENGVDIPGANTLIVYDADFFGLSQLYQLRGRVGRSNRLAYAYFTVRTNKAIGEVAQKRLDAIEEFTQMGSGFRIAMRDLEIRGAGNLLGGEQHGHMMKIGYDLYCKMVKETVEEARGMKKEEKSQATVEVRCDAFLSAEYIPSESQKFAAYRKIAAIESKEDMLDIRDELHDRYGELPAEVENLLAVSYIRALAAGAGISVIRQTDSGTAILFPKPDLEKISAAVGRFPGKCVITAGRIFTVVLRSGKTAETLSLLRDFLVNLNEK